MSQTLRLLKISQLDLARVLVNRADVGVAFLLQGTAILGGLGDELRAHDHLAASLLERFALASDGVVLVLRLHTTSW